MLEKFKGLSTGKKVIVAIIAMVFLPITLVALSVNLVVSGIKNRKIIKIGAGLICTIFTFIFAVGMYSSTNSSNEVSSSNKPEVEDTILGEEPVKEEKENVNTESKQEEVAKEETKQEEKVPTEYQSALKKAKSYSNTMSMSKAGLYDQLTSEYGEKFSPEAAQYAIDNVDADWNANALKKAKSYSDTMNMSKAGIFDQLTSEHGEKFTAEEAQYAIDNVQANWNENALKKAKSYESQMAMSPSAIFDQLTSEYGEKFTAEEAQYAIDNLEQ